MAESNMIIFIINRMYLIFYFLLNQHKLLIPKRVKILKVDLAKMLNKNKVHKPSIINQNKEQAYYSKIRIYLQIKEEQNCFLKMQ